MLKKALLQQLFPQKDEINPQIRFTDFHDDWEPRKIDSIFKITRGQVLSSKKIKLKKDFTYKYPVYSSQTKNDGLMGYYNEYLFKNGITWTTDGANAGTVKYRHGKFYSTNVNGVLLEKYLIPNKMISESLNLIAYKFVSKVGNPKLMNNTMANIRIDITLNLEEQEKISNIFNKIDASIKINKKKINKIQNFKKSLLQNMFI
ncbi:restriction endonuclease subunit S [Fructilactobacillus cliffordii]|uniref:restriction endonuclease subunit S n=1 Tax=Fructilactobacillus cliffordii TaxID=2940299 RepID=UPI002092171A|nr:restriction endonuclease subunit S [Fructilactobacillus cliffordii]USS86151.1 restriction endonuclease subunit S [Fructilactobacillus cliffordii]